MSARSWPYCWSREPLRSCRILMRRCSAKPAYCWRRAARASAAWEQPCEFSMRGCVESLPDLTTSWHRLTVASDFVRPSGPYTLQCMMPNVAAGRAALQMDLNGPNFVIDAGSNSLEAAAVAASLLLRAGDHGGTRLAIVTAINTNPWRVPLRDSSLPEEEYAAAFAVTSRRYAKELRLSCPRADGGASQDELQVRR